MKPRGIIYCLFGPDYRGQKPACKGARGRLANPLEKNPMSDPAAVQKMRQSKMGQKMSDTTKARMRIAQSARRKRERGLLEESAK